VAAAAFLFWEGGGKNVLAISESSRVESSCEPDDFVHEKS
jgi:hypothetical protein